MGIACDVKTGEPLCQDVEYVDDEDCQDFGGIDVDYKEAVKILVAHGLCCLMDGESSCDVCPARIEDEDGCNYEMTSDKKIREAVDLILMTETNN